MVPEARGRLRLATTDPRTLPAEAFRGRQPIASGTPAGVSLRPGSAERGCALWVFPAPQAHPTADVRMGFLFATTEARAQPARGRTAARAAQRASRDFCCSRRQPRKIGGETPPPPTKSSRRGLRPPPV